MLIRKETPEDYAAVIELNSSVFDTDAEAELVEALRDAELSTVSLVAEERGKVVGHIFFSPVTALNGENLKIAGLAPMAVVKNLQQMGIGSVLVKEGLKCCQAGGVGAVVVLGHPGYYPRFGFLPSTTFEIESEYDVVREAFMAMELVDNYLINTRGKIRYHPAFAEV